MGILIWSEPNQNSLDAPFSMWRWMAKERVEKDRGLKIFRTLKRGVAEEFGLSVLADLDSHLFCPETVGRKGNDPILAASWKDAFGKFLLYVPPP